MRIALFARATAFCGTPAVTRAKSRLVVALVEQLQMLERQLQQYRLRIDELFEQHPDHELFGSLPHSTNNVAEYNGLLAALDWCRNHGATRVHVKSDSLLLVQQMKGVYKVKNEGLKPLYGRARLVSHEIGQVTFEHVRREFNKEADKLANRAMDELTR